MAHNQNSENSNPSGLDSLSPLDPNPSDLHNLMNTLSVLQHFPPSVIGMNASEIRADAYNLYYARLKKLIFAHATEFYLEEDIKDIDQLCLRYCYNKLTSESFKVDISDNKLKIRW